MTCSLFTFIPRKVRYSLKLKGKTSKFTLLPLSSSAIFMGVRDEDEPERYTLALSLFLNQEP
ncbi:hypothetical protein [Sulfuracidifex metallicus]|uniref:hypothetical protein n=1 Tax=Sulfuracidifex metallicus TaxID=47303 RepID=UPI001F109ABE|nr:hypothetical protein [Sulfuracidifex metallicus]WOE52024.1 hypothetical protein RQ359_001184 [Sulfuracidifex metallicus DSM 6482 = JCM 9184]